MITNTGKSIIIKYLLGQAPAYASYIAAGCGALPVKQISFPVSAKAIEEDVARLTVGTHDLKVGDFITVSDVDTVFNGIHQISETSSTTVSYAKTASDVGSFSSPVTVSPTGRVSRNYSNKKSLDFEMFRIPITSKGYVQEDGVSKVVLTGTIPSSDRYEITELGVYSAASNPSAQLTDSKNLFLFVKTEGWEYHDETASIEIPNVINKLDIDPEDPGVIYTGTEFGSEIVSTDANCFVADASNSTFNSELRIARQEGSRNLGPSIFLKGDSSLIIKQATINNVAYTATTATYTTTQDHGLLPGDSVTISGLSPSGYNGTFSVTEIDPGNKTFTVANTTNTEPTDESGSVILPRFAVASGAHIHNASDVELTLDRNSPTDELHTAFSIVSTDPTSNGEAIETIGSVRISIRFSNTHQTDISLTAFAQLDIELDGATTNFEENRYFVDVQQLQDLSRYSNFTWAETAVVLVNACVLDTSGNPMDEYYVALDGIRLENISSENPLYGLVAYTVVENETQGSTGTYAKPIVKLPNTSNFIEFRYALDVI
jgi:hypothetical protein